MKIYRVDVNNVADDSFAIISSAIAQRTTKKSEYYSSKDKADQRCKDLYDGAIRLLGFIPKFEAVVIEVDVIE